MNTLNEIISWYHENCDGDWEHNFGVKIDTICNPGWRIELNIEDTYLENKKFHAIEIDRHEEDWLHCEVRDNVFLAACGVRNLEETLRFFIDWKNN